MIRFIRLAILNLAGVPSIVFGLFGLACSSSSSVECLPPRGSFTLALMTLPVVITASEESLRAVPPGSREGSLALGATKWQTIRKNVLPYALRASSLPPSSAIRACRRNRAHHVYRGLCHER